MKHDKLVRNAIRAFGILIVISFTAVLASCPNSLLGELQAQLDTNFGQTTKTLTVSAGPGGSVVPEGPRELKADDVLDITATPDAGKQFMSWAQIGGAGTVAFGNINAAVTTVSLSEGDASIQATFGDLPRTLTVQAAANGSITTPSSSPVVVSDNTPYGIVATPASGYNFVSWSQVAGTGTASFANANNASTNVTVTGGDATIRATFVAKQYTLTLTVNTTQGSISNPYTTNSTTSVLVSHDVARAISAGSPKLRGYYFSGWTKTTGTGNAVFANASSPSTTVTVTGGDVTIRANYALITATLEPRGYFNLNDTNAVTARRMDDPNDFVYYDGFVYVAGNFGTTPKIIKIDVSSPSNLSYSATNDLGANKTAESVIVDGSYLDIAVSGEGIRRIAFNNFAVDTPYHTEPTIRNITTGGWYDTGADVYRFYNYGSIEPNTYVFNLLYVSDYNYLYVTGTDDMGSMGSISTISNPSADVLTEEYQLDIDEFPTEMVFNGDVYLYAAAGNDGLITFFLDDAPDISVSDVEGTSVNTGNSIVGIDAYGNYLITGGKNTGSKDKFCIYDIHGNNGSISEPYFLYSRDSAELNGNIVTMDMYGSYLYVLEGTYLQVYEFSAITN